MNLSKLADLSEIVSSVAIVVTLIYLVVEINQNTDALYAESRQSVLTASQAELFELVEHPDIILSVVKEQPLTEADQVKIGAWLAAAMRAREFSWLQYSSGIIDEAQWASEVLIIRWLLDTARTRDWWRNVGRFNSNPGFVAFVEKDMKGRPATGDGWKGEASWAEH